MEKRNPPDGMASEGLNFNDLLQILKLRRKILYVFTAMAILGVIAKQLLYVPLYTAQTTLSIQKIENSPMQMALANIGQMPLDTSDRLKKYVDYLQSDEFFVAVAETLKFKDGYQKLNLTPPWELSITRKKFWVEFLANNFGNKSLPLANAPEPVLVPVESLSALLRNVTGAEIMGNDMVKIRVTTLDPFTSMVLANTVTEVFVKKTSERDYNEVTEVKKFIEQQLDSTTERLKRSESALVDFKRHNNIISIDAEHNAFSNKLSSIESELETTRIRREENAKLIAFYERALAKREQQLLNRGAGAAKLGRAELVARTRAQLDAQQYKRVLMQAQGFAENSWQVIELNREIEKLTRSLKEQLADGDPSAAGQEEEVLVNFETARAKLAALQAENRGYDAKISTLESSRAALLKSLGSLPRDEQVLLNLTKDLDLQFELYSMLKKKLQEVEIQQVALQSRVAINERSGLGSPAPRTRFIAKLLFALLVSCFFGSTVAFLLEAIDPTIKHLADLQRLEVVTLGSIPRIETSEVRKTLGARSYRPDLLICKEQPESVESIAFKYIRAQITRMRAADGSPSKIITVTSPERGDGKTLVTANLAVSLSQLEKKVLLIDTDFRNPSVPWYFGYRDGHGLTSVLTLRASLDEVLLRERLPFLDILPAGWAQPNPTELLSNDKFRLLLEHLRDSYDYILMDAPPALLLVDASILAGISDNVILVTGFRKTRKPNVLLALRRILQVSNKHVYGLLNGLEETPELGPIAVPSTFHENSLSAGMDSKSELARFQQLLKDRKAG
ncbi:MAG: polysaccharide biosynthesis tyrosine autokinase [Oligoflexia bacterium]|nr:polysaccharide biosynthesis tyrosine autokinase [Oligoflexia bacterium]